MGLHGFFIEKIFARLSCPAGRERAIAFYDIKKRRMAHGAHPSLISGFLKEIVVWTLFPSAKSTGRSFQSFTAPASA
jgi:hypothetical protein